MKTPERRQRRSGVFIVNFEHILQLALVFIVNFEQVNADLGQDIRIFLLILKW